MTTHMPQEPRPDTVGFTRLLDQALMSANQYRQTYHYALDIGIRPEELINYVRGRIGVHERRGFEHNLSRSPWALQRVVALVKAMRTPGSLGAQILAACNTDPYAWGIKRMGDVDTDLCLLLERIG